MPTSLSPELAKVLATCVEHWFRNTGGTSCLDLAQSLNISHASAMAAVEQLVACGYGSMNGNVELFQVTFDLKDPSAGLKSEPIVTHIFFPSKDSLREAFYASDLSKTELPEYVTRMRLGANQIELVWFTEDVLSRYMKHPEFYDLRDSLAGGDVSTNSSAPSDRHLWVRYGKARLGSGQIAVTAIYKDLADMSPAEQYHWRAHEIGDAKPDPRDRHFRDFLARTYDGEFVDYEDPLSSLVAEVAKINAAFGDPPLMKAAENVHLHLPVDSTYKAYCDSASELYKIVGPDNLSSSAIKKILSERFGLPQTEFVHKESQRPLSSLQLLTLLEDVIGASGLVTKPIREVGSLRVAADHKILAPASEAREYSREFADLCSQLSSGLEGLASLIEGHRK